MTQQQTSLREEISRHLTRLELKESYEVTHDDILERIMIEIEKRIDDKITQYKTTAWFTPNNIFDDTMKVLEEIKEMLK